MTSPAKKRKLNSATKQTPMRGLEYFFSRQRENAAPGNSSSSQDSTVGVADEGLSDEALARKLQAEWDAEERNGTTQEFRKVNENSDLPENKGCAESSGPKSLAASSQTTPLTDAPALKVLLFSPVAAMDDEALTSIPLDQSPLTFDPAEYMAQIRKSWASGDGSASYAFLTRCFFLVDGTQSRIKTVDTLVNCVRILVEADPDSLLPAVWLATNSISPPYISKELGLGVSAISKALKQVCGLDSRALKAIYDKLGDPGDVAFEAKKKQSFTLRQPKPLTIKSVYQSLVKLAATQGPGSNEAKQRIVDRLLQDARGGEESRYIVRTLCQHLRIGAVNTTMLISLSRAFLLSRPPGADFTPRDARELRQLKKEELVEIWSRAEEIVKACYARHPSYDDLVPALLEMGVCDGLLLRCGLALHVPIRPMLGSITRDLAEMLTKLQGRDFACEFKYDGQRAQMHCDANGKVSIFSRHLELMTEKYPDLVALIPKMRGEGVQSFIMEGEVVAVDRETGELKTFQTLTNRARRDVAIASITVDVCMFAFDLMYLNGQPLLDRSFRERRELLRSMFVEMPNRFTWARSMDATSQDSETVLDFFKSATESKCEGIMVKILDNLLELDDPDAGGQTDPPASYETLVQNAPSKQKARSRRKPLLATYEPDKRLDSWLKVKKDYHSTFDTLDLIPVAAWHGQGRKLKWWSPILLAVREPESGTLEAVCKCISGFTDAFYKSNREFYDNGQIINGEPKNTRARKPAFVDYAGHPDVWFEPCEVWEVAFADITISPTYTAAIGLVREDKGLSLRFPRFLRKREDKGIEEASTSEFLAGLWRKQLAIGSHAILDDGNQDKRGNSEGGHV